MRRLLLACSCVFLAGMTCAPASAQAVPPLHSLGLDVPWNFVADPEGKLSVSDLATVRDARTAQVPGSWQAQFADLRDYAGVAWYWLTVPLEPLAREEVALLRFGAVDYRAEVFVNGQRAGTHEGGYLPFEFDITSLVRSGKNEIAVRVADAGGKRNEVEGIRYAEIPHGKQSWYVQTSGIWQSVELAIGPRVRLGGVHITAGAEGNFEIGVPVVSPEEVSRPVRVSAEIRDPASKIVWSATRELKPGRANIGFAGKIANAKLWSLEAPTLYMLRVWLNSGDQQLHRFGFRTFQTRGGKFYLNGQPIYLRGALDQDFYPETIYTPPWLGYIRDEMRKAKALGLNLLRCHIKVPDPRYLEAADEVGILVWYEIPNWGRLTDDSERRAMETLRGMAERDWNHPSVIAVSLINESWGINLKEEAQRQWLKQAYAEARRIVPGWLVVDNSACCDNFHVATDIADFHTYSAMPDNAASFDKFVAELATRPAWLFSKAGDAAPRGDEPLVLSEFGNWGLPRLPEKKPWWWSRPFGNNTIALPEGVEQRFKEYGFDSLFPDYNALADATQWHQFRALKHEIESLRAQQTIQGYVITEFTDLNWESNGLLDMWRRPKTYAEALARVQQDDAVIVRSQRRDYFAGEMVTAEVLFSHYGSTLQPPAEVRWSLAGTPSEGKFALPVIERSGVTRVATVEVVAPSTQAPTPSRLKVEVVAGQKVIAANELSLFFFPRGKIEESRAVSLHDPGGRLASLWNAMQERGYKEPNDPTTPAALIASAYDDTVKRELAAGRTVILLPGEKMTLAPGLEVVPRAGSVLDGNWISGFLWTRNNVEPFRNVAFDTLAGFETQAAAPRFVVQGIPATNFRDVLAGMFFGWLHSNVGVVVQARAGKGRLIVCTFSFADTYGSDPYATYLLDALLRYAASDFQPIFEIPM